MTFTLQGTIEGKYETITSASSNDGKQYSIGEEIVTASEYIHYLYLMFKNSDSKESFRIITQ